MPRGSNDPAWLAYRAERARLKADKAEAEAQDLERRYREAMRLFNQRTETYLAELRAKNASRA